VVQFYESLSRTVPRGITLPEKDEPILLAAMEARADYLLTGDFQHFGRYFGKKIEGILIATPAQYLRIRNG
jgi:predicted nucleic acid-binding protein